MSSSTSMPANPPATASSTSTPTHAPSETELDLQTTHLNTASSVTLSPPQTTLLKSVLDLFKGHPSLAKLQLWTEDATFSDPLTLAKGRKQYQAQWYGLSSAFSEIDELLHEVTSAGNPMEVKLKMRYKVKAIGKVQEIESLVKVWTTEVNEAGEGARITRVEDRWDGKLPDGGIQNAFRRLNAVTVPGLVGVPKNDEQDAKKGHSTD